MAIPADVILRDWNPRVSLKTMSQIASEFKTQSLIARNEATTFAASNPLNATEILLQAELPYWEFLIQAYDRWITSYDPNLESFRFSAQVGTLDKVKANRESDLQIMSVKLAEFQAARRVRIAREEAERARIAAEQAAEAERQRQIEEQQRRLAEEARIRTAAEEEKKRLRTEETARRTAVRAEWLRAAQERSRIAAEKRARLQAERQAEKELKASEQLARAREVTERKTIRILTSTVRKTSAEILKDAQNTQRSAEQDLSAQLRKSGLTVRETRRITKKVLDPIKQELIHKDKIRQTLPNIETPEEKAISEKSARVIEERIKESTKDEFEWVKNLIFLGVGLLIVWLTKRLSGGTPGVDMPGKFNAWAAMT